ncbi:glycosyltransferase, partial [Planktomarina temperata]|nr:glycosyltransferase [Planktomarina temperata]
MRTQRILWANFYCLVDTSSGASLSIRQILKNLLAQGFAVDIVGATNFDSENGGKWFSELKKNHEDKEYINFKDDGLLHQLSITSSLSRSEMTTSEISKWFALYQHRLREFKPDLVMFYGGQPPDFLIAQEARRRGIPTAAYLVNGNYQSNAWCADVDLILTDTQATSDYYKKKLGINPVPVGKFIPKNGIVSKQRNPQRLLFINPTLAKGGAIVATLALALEDIRPDIKFQVVESRGNWAEIVKAVTTKDGNERNELSNVIVTPHTSDMRPVYQDARVLLAPSLWWESGARVLAEASLNSIPAIVTDYGGNREMLAESGFKLKLPEQFHNKPFNQSPPKEVLAPVIDLICKLFDDDNFYGEAVKKVQRVSDRKFDNDVNTKNLVSFIIPFLDKMAGDLEHNKLLKDNHKHNVVDMVDNVVDIKNPLCQNERGIFIDCGGYDGCSAIKFLRVNPDFDCISFEPNPSLWHYYDDVPSTLIKKAAWVHNGTEQLLIDESDADGSTLLKDKKVDFHKRVANADCATIIVDCFDIVDIIRKSSAIYDKIVLKLDV